MEKLKDKFDQAVWTVERCKGLHVTVRRGRVKCQYAGKSMDSLMVLAANSGLLRPVLRSKTAAMRS